MFTIDQYIKSTNTPTKITAHNDMSIIFKRFTRETENYVEGYIPKSLSIKMMEIITTYATLFNCDYSTAYKRMINSKATQFNRVTNNGVSHDCLINH